MAAGAARLPPLPQQTLEHVDLLTLPPAAPSSQTSMGHTCLRPQASALLCASLCPPGQTSGPVTGLLVSTDAYDWPVKTQRRLVSTDAYDFRTVAGGIELEIPPPSTLLLQCICPAHSSAAA